MKKALSIAIAALFGMLVVVLVCCFAKYSFDFASWGEADRCFLAIMALVGGVQSAVLAAQLYD